MAAQVAESAGVESGVLGFGETAMIDNEKLEADPACATLVGRLTLWQKRAEMLQGDPKSSADLRKAAEVFRTGADIYAEFAELVAKYES